MCTVENGEGTKESFSSSNKVKLLEFNVISMVKGDRKKTYHETC